MYVCMYRKSYVMTTTLPRLHGPGNMTMELIVYLSSICPESQEDICRNDLPIA